MQVPQITFPVELELVLRLVLAAVAGGLVGLEREQAEKPAGLRTHTLVCLGSTLFTLVSIHGFGGPVDPARIAANIVVGVGFLGAGTIIRGQIGGEVLGLTTAASIWLVAAVGLSIGVGLYLLAGATVVITLIVLRLPHRVG